VDCAAEGAKIAFDQRVSHPEQLEDGLADFFCPSVLILLIPLKELDKGLQC
jgi:hypothetical protein